jgi:hypothetical protein
MKSIFNQIRGLSIAEAPASLLKHAWFLSGSGSKLSSRL